VPTEIAVRAITPARILAHFTGLVWGKKQGRTFYLELK
jgi:hypothetical protein